jgi:hypothetical protein
MIDQKAVEELRTQIADAEEHDDPAVSITFGCARALLTASQARDEIVEGIKSTFLASTIEGPCVWVSFETTQCAERFIASLKTGERDAG